MSRAIISGVIKNNTAKNLRLIHTDLEDFEGTDIDSNTSKRVRGRAAYESGISSSITYQIGENLDSTALFFFDWTPGGEPKARCSLSDRTQCQGKVISSNLHNSAGPIFELAYFIG